MHEWKPENDINLLNAVQEFLNANIITIDGDVTYEAGIDYVSVKVDGKEFLGVGLPPVSNYRVWLADPNPVKLFDE